MAKPQQILELEKTIDTELVNREFESIMNYKNNGYALNSQCQIIGLNLDFCNLTNIRFLRAFENLKYLSLRGNRIISINTLSKLKNLKKVCLSHNQICNIDSLKELTSLSHLFLDSNEIRKLSAWILKFNLDIYISTPTTNTDNYSDYPNGIFLDYNPLVSPPPEIIERGHRAIKSFFESLNSNQFDFSIFYSIEFSDSTNPFTTLNSNPFESSDSSNLFESFNFNSWSEYSNSFEKLEDYNFTNGVKLNEVKILFVGDGSAGKTSLCKLLLGEPFDAQESQTHGINIHHWQQNDLTLHLWDFGGQEIMHATHQFFLSKRSLYILVLDGRKEEDAEYWLKHIQSFGGDSPVLVVLNKTDEHPAFDLNRQHLLSKYPNIQGFYKLSCKNNHGFGEFQTGFQQAFAKVEMLQNIWPRSWFNIKIELEDLQKSLKKNYITCEEYHAICKKEEIADNQTQEILAQYLHDLGIIVHFSDFELNDTHILEPRWITEAVYKIINSKQLAQKQGLLCLKDLAAILKKETDSDFDYPKEKYRHIIKLMEKFELCYRVNDNHILIPDLLSIQQPKFELTEKQLLRFRLKYDFLPKSIMPRFIVKLHEKIQDELRWRTGVVLYDEKTKATALIRSDDHDKLIDIQVEGEQKRDFFAVIRNTLNEIHKSFEKLEITELVPLPDYPEICIEYAELIGYELDGEDNYRVGKLRKVYSVAELLNGIEKPEERHKEGNTYIEKQEVIMGNKYETNDVDNTNGSFNIGENNKIETADTKDESLFKKWQFWLSVFGFIYFCLVLFAAYDLQNGSKLGNKTFERIVLAPIPLLKTDDKK